MTFIIDAHLDIAVNHIAYGRDFRDSSFTTQHREQKQTEIATVGMPDMLLGRVGIVFATLWVSPPTTDLMPSASYESPQQAYQQAMRQLDYYKRLADEDDRIRLVRDRASLNEVVNSWADGKAFADHKLGIVILMEGADPIIEPQQTEQWYEQGVRIIGPAWQATRYSAGTGAPGKVTKLGWGLLEVMQSFNMVLDLSHMAEHAFLEAVESYGGHLIASHSNPRRFCDTDRHLSDDMIRRLAERDGVMGIVPYNRFLQTGWKNGRKSDITVETVLDAIDHVCQVTGSARHVGIGTDWDGGFGWESIPAPFDSHIDLWRLHEWLLRRDFDETDVQNILYGNFLRILKASLPA